MRLFADDTSLTASDKNIDKLLLQINSQLLNIYDWLCANKLTLNLKKTKYLIFQPRQKMNYNLLPPLTLAGQCLEQVASLKYLGIYIDDHITYICDKISKCINIMIKVKRYLGNQCLTSIYYSLIAFDEGRTLPNLLGCLLSRRYPVHASEFTFSAPFWMTSQFRCASCFAVCRTSRTHFLNLWLLLVYPYFIYGCILWGNNYENPLLQLIRLQNNAIRIINDVPLQDHITPHYVNLGLLKFRDVVKMYTCLFFYDHLCDNKPCNFSISLVSEQHNYSIRTATSLQLFLPYSRTNIRKFCPTVIGKYILEWSSSFHSKYLIKNYFQKSRVYFNAKRS